MSWWQIRVKTGAPQKTICDVFAEFYNEGKRPEDQVCGKNFRDRIDRITKANEAELKSRTETIKDTETELGERDEKERAIDKAISTNHDQCSANACSETSSFEPNPKDKMELVEELFRKTKDHLRELDVSEITQKLFYLEGLESYYGCHGFHVDKPQRAIKRLIDVEKFGTESLARMIMQGIQESECLQIRDIDTLVEWLRKLKEEMEEMVDESVVTTNTPEGEGTVYHREGRKLHTEEWSSSQQ